MLTKQMSGKNTAGTIPVVGGNEGVGCTVLKCHEGGSAYQDTIEQINGEGMINYIVPTPAP